MQRDDQSIQRWPKGMLLPMLPLRTQSFEGLLGFPGVATSLNQILFELNHIFFWGKKKLRCHKMEIATALGHGS